jgi:hypothetical protein
VAAGTRGNEEAGEGFNKPDSKTRKKQMKKLMITAAAAAVGLTSFGELCVEDTATDSCAVYNVKFTFKTLAAKKDSGCGLTWLIDDDLNSVWLPYDVADAEITDETVKAGGRHDQTVRPRFRAAKRRLFWADNATRTFDGILWQCRATCFEGVNFRLNARRRANGRLNWALWEKKSKESIALPVLRYYTKKDRSQYGWWTPDAQWDFDFLGRYGQKAQKVAMYWTPWIMRGTIDAAGFGTFDNKNQRMTSVSGNAVGMLAPLTTDGKVCGRDNEFFVQVGFMCVDWENWCCPDCYAGVERVPASGTWSIKYNASLSTGKKSLAKILPDYAVFGEKVFGSAAFARIRNFVNTYFWNVVLDANGIFYAPRYLNFLIDGDGNPIESTKVTDADPQDTYLGTLARQIQGVVELELYADREGSNYVLTYVTAVDYSSADKAYKGTKTNDNGETELVDSMKYDDGEKKWAYTGEGTDYNPYLEYIQTILTDFTVDGELKEPTEAPPYYPAEEKKD